MRDILRDEMDPLMAPTDRGYSEPPPTWRGRGITLATTEEVAVVLGVTRAAVDKAERKAMLKLWRGMQALATDPEVVAAWRDAQ